MVINFGWFLITVNLPNLLMTKVSQNNRKVVVCVITEMPIYVVNIKLLHPVWTVWMACDVQCVLQTCHDIEIPTWQLGQMLTFQLRHIHIHVTQDPRLYLSHKYRVGHKKPSPILFCLKCYCICLYGQNDTPYKLLVCSAYIDVKS